MKRIGRLGIWYGSVGWGWCLYGISYGDRWFLGFSKARFQP